MSPSVVVEGARVFLGDCRDVLKTLPDNSVDSVVTDPPYELGFMGKSWDSSGIAYDVTVWEECLRVLKPGGHILAFGGTRTWHRLAVAIEDAGFEIRDNIAWIYGSGFPKSLDVSKAVDKKLGAERGKIRVDASEVRNPKATGGGRDGVEGATRPWIEKALEVGFHEKDSDNPASPEAQKWQGWGTALKPAFEPVVVGRKPIEGTVANNVLRWGVGGLNIDGSRITGEDAPEGRSRHGGGIAGNGTSYELPDSLSKMPEGRWPANVVLDEFTAGLLDEQSGNVKGQVGMTKTKGGHRFIEGDTETAQKFDYGKTDSGGASRFFYQAKASKRDRNEGLEDLGDTHPSEVTGRKVGSAGAQNGGYAGMTETPRKNFHPTVKPTQLMRYLIKLVTPEGGTVLDPFTGSGSTGKAALLDGYGFIGAELTEEYLPIIEGRLRWAVENRDEETLF